MNISGGRNTRIDPALQKRQRPHILHFLADHNTASALDTFRRLQDDRSRGFIRWEVRQKLIKSLFPDPEVRGQRLQFAVAVTPALKAITRMIRKDQLQHRPADIDDLRIVRQDIHALFHGSAAGPQHLAVALDLHHTNPAPGGRMQIRMLAQSRYPDVRLAGHIQNHFPGIEFYRDTVNNCF